MKKEVFDKFISEKSIRSTIDSIKYRAYHIHDVDCNQKYGDDLPYSTHLGLVGFAVQKYGHLVCEYEHHIVPIFFGAYFHDSIEDARLTYNDVMKIAKEYMTDYQAFIATEIVYALTDEKGRNRSERGSEKHYEDIRNTLYAPFVKWCDRYANYAHSENTNSRMAKVYEEEMPEFIRKLGGTKYIPKELIDLIQ